ncbi:hypothetical protein HZY86_03345 [Aerococcaceae bacterium DSM 111020]|nr:hypothetical protein [Aerococcaceae bacterium DSM 111020]
MITWNVLLFLIGMFLIVTAVFNRLSVLYLGLSVLTFGIYFWTISFNLLLFLVFMLGILLIIVELYVPDFGVIGILGLGAILYALWMIYQDVSAILIILLLALFVIVFLSSLYLRAGCELVLSPGFVLDEAIESHHHDATKADTISLVGTQGTALTTLRPVGKARLKDEHCEVISDEEFISAGQPIQVTKVRGNQIYVRKVEQ